MSSTNFTDLSSLVAPIQAQHKYTLGVSAVALWGGCWSFIASLFSQSHLLAFARIPCFQIRLLWRLCLPSPNAVGTSIEPYSILLSDSPSRELMMGKNVASTYLSHRLMLSSSPAACRASMRSGGSLLRLSLGRGMPKSALSIELSTGPRVLKFRAVTSQQAVPELRASSLEQIWGPGKFLKLWVISIDYDGIRPC